MYLDVAVEAGPTAVWNLEMTIVAHFQVVSFMGNYLPGTLNVGWEVLREVWRLDDPII